MSRFSSCRPPVGKGSGDFWSQIPLPCKPGALLGKANSAHDSPRQLERSEGAKNVRTMRKLRSQGAFSLPCPFTRGKIKAIMLFDRRQECSGAASVEDRAVDDAWESFAGLFEIFRSSSKVDYVQ